MLRNARTFSQILVTAFVAHQVPARYQPEPLADVRLGPENVTWSKNAPRGTKKGVARYNEMVENTDTHPPAPFHFELHYCIEVSTIVVASSTSLTPQNNTEAGMKKCMKTGMVRW